MPLPKSDRVLYEVNPLDPVICQLRFPTILRITNEDPVAFQEAVRKKYPKYERVSSPEFQFPPELPKEVANLLFPEQGPRPHRFSESNRRRSFVLSQDSISYTDSDYRSWEEFSGDLFPAIETLNEVYEIGYYSRVGLRYVNKISRSELGITNHPWTELLNPIILGAMGDKTFGEEVTASAGQFEALIDDLEGATVKVKYGLIPPNRDEITDSVFKIDIDFGVTGEIEHAQVRTILGKFNEMDRGLFQWSIKKRLHQAMGPR